MPEKTTPKRKKQARRKLPIFHGLLFVLACMLVSGVLFGLSRPYVQAQKIRHENDKFEVSVNRQKMELAKYQNDLRLWNTPEGIELIARRYGWIKPGEQRLRIIPH